MAGAPPPPPPPPPAAQSKGGPSQNAAINGLLKQYPKYRPYLTTILQAAKDYKLDPTVLLSFLAFENGSADPNARSSAGALGLAQILDKQAAQTNAAGVPFFRPSQQISDSDKRDPSFAIKYMAWRVGGLIASGRSIHDAYAGPGGYNPGFTGDSRGADPGALISKTAPNYVPQVSASPQAQGAQQATTTAARQTFTKFETDRWVVRDKNGTIGFAQSLEPPKNVVLFQGQPLLRSTLQAARQQSGGYDDTFEAYTGKAPTDTQVVNAMAQGVSMTGLAIALSKTKAFVDSPIWHAHAPGVIGVAKSFYGDKWKPDTNLVRRAIVENWDQATLEENLKNGPDYFKGPVFKDAAAKLANVYESIYGPLTPAARKIIQQATLTGETPDEFAGELRQRPGYAGSTEQANARASLESAYEQSFGHPPTGQAASLVERAARENWNSARLIETIKGNKKLYAQTGEPADKKAALVSAYESVYGVAPDNKGLALIQNAQRQGWSPQRLATYIRSQPKIYQHTNEYQGTVANLTDAYTQIFGAPPDANGQKLVDQAAHKGWSPAQLATYVRKNPLYLNSGEYKQRAVNLETTYENIYGRPDSNAGVVIREAALQGWTPDQFASYLRSQPAYTSSPEYHGSMLSFADALGLITGGTPVLRPGAKPAANPAALQPGPPDSTRVAGTPHPLNRPDNLGLGRL